jgi:sugar O-acyltransferase (sialic acid O-acetyltransferase NeuD family)
MPERFLIWGAGGHGRVVSDVIRAMGDEVVGFVDREPGNHRFALPTGAEVPLLAEAEIQGPVLPLGATAVALGIGDNPARWRVFHRLEGDRCPALVHPSAIVGSGVHFGEGTAVMPRAVVNPATTIGRAVIVNTGAIVEHDCRIGDAAHLSPGSVVCGGAELGSGVWLGAGATVIPGIRIGADAVIGAGSTVIRDVPAGARVAGSPARPLADRETSR